MFTVWGPKLQVSTYGNVSSKMGSSLASRMYQECKIYCKYQFTYLLNTSHMLFRSKSHFGSSSKNALHHCLGSIASKYSKAPWSSAFISSMYLCQSHSRVARAICHSLFLKTSLLHPWIAKFWCRCLTENLWCASGHIALTTLISPYMYNIMSSSCIIIMSSSCIII